MSFWYIEEISDSDNVEFQARLVTDLKVGLLSLPLAAAMHLLPNSTTGELVLAVGTTTKVISIYTGTPQDGFHLSTALEGHEDWIRSLAFKKTEDGVLMLASGCQDRYIRIWSVQPDVDLLASSEPQNELEEEDDSLDQLRNIVYQLDTKTPYAIRFDALIIGHDDWVYSLRWHPSEVKLMSSSADSSVMVWIPDTTSGVWLCSARLGDISSKGASTATGSYGGVWFSAWIGANNSTIVSLTNMGSWKCWKTIDLDTSDVSDEPQQELWIPHTGLTGHIKSVTDISWSPDGSFVLTTSLDKTTRLFAPFEGSWYEVSRPQIHGYEMMCIHPLASNLFVSGGDEKILRVFKATKVIANLLNNLLGFTTIDADLLDSEVATVPVLSLSNKARSSAPQGQDNENGDNDEIEEDYTKHGLDLTKPPLEDQLQRHTLWPEIEKIYSHGYEMITLTSTHDGSLIVSACKANSKDHAVIRTTNVRNWLEASKPLSFHTLTITRLQFSHDDKLLLSVSRDRTWSVWTRGSGETTAETEFRQLAFGKGHTRIIWDCCWFQPRSISNEQQSSNTYYFATASRDKSVKIWKSTSADLSEWAPVLTITTAAPVTAIDVALVEQGSNCSYVLAVGLDTGDLTLYTIQISDEEKKEGQGDNNVSLVSEQKVRDNITPTGRINRVTWSEPRTNKEKRKLAVASEDHSVRIYSLIT